MLGTEYGPLLVFAVVAPLARISCAVLRSGQLLKLQRRPPQRPETDRARSYQSSDSEFVKQSGSMDS